MKPGLPRIGSTWTRKRLPGWPSYKESVAIKVVAISRDSRNRKWVEYDYVGEDLSGSMPLNTWGKANADGVLHEIETGLERAIKKLNDIT
jgi:hypothetical protein